jgi:hypothetical protein
MCLDQGGNAQRHGRLDSDGVLNSVSKIMTVGMGKSRSELDVVDVWAVQKEFISIQQKFCRGLQSRSD